jgi:hypothetical protein
MESAPWERVVVYQKLAASPFHFPFIIKEN